MSRKRTNLDTAEAEYLYANVLLEFNKYESFQTLSIPERNGLIDKVCIATLEQSCKNEEHVEAVTQEILSYRLSKEDEVKFYSDTKYTKGLEKPENFNALLKKRHLDLLCNLVKAEFLNVPQNGTI